MTPDQHRLDRTARLPRITMLWQTLQGLRSPISFMMSGAHPDDEMSPMMAALYMRDGVNLAYACSTRGEGGQNDLGTERGARLGALRTAEMEAACDRLMMQMFWLSEGPDDPILDWRFSKSGTETLGVWGHDRTVARFVHVLRVARPDMLCPTFLDVPGQHGHHRAMTQAAHEAFAAAADPAYGGSDLPPWQVSKLYLPAWSGAGRAYDDDLPPPPQTVAVDGRGSDPVTGWPYAVIGAMSHGAHRSQGMGHWPDDQRLFPLHLAETRVGPDQGAVTDNLPRSFADLGLSEVQALIDDMITGFADSAALLQQARAAYDLLTQAAVAPDHQHRVARAQRQLARVMALCGPVPLVSPSKSWLRPGERAQLSEPVALALPPGWTQTDTTVGPTESAALCDGYRDCYDPLDPPKPAIRLRDDATGAETLWPLDRPLMASPAQSCLLAPTGLMINLATGQSRAQSRILQQKPAEAALSLDLPSGWHAEQTGDSVDLQIPEQAEETQHSIPIRLNGTPAHEVTPIDYPHIRPTQALAPAILRVSVLRAVLPGHAVGYIGADLDRVPQRLGELGLEVIDLSAPGPRPEALAQVQSLIIGIHAMRFNPALAAGLGGLHSWVRDGGRLLTLYHRPWDNWDPDHTPPVRLEIGQPSLRWRVTNKEAPVQILQPDHPVLRGPNPITQADFDGWDKERGLYFAKSWDPAYQPLLALSDPGEEPLLGGLLSAQIGKGRHIHCALNLHHQIDQMIPGATRLLVNLVC